jgi:hypothetical protein
VARADAAASTRLQLPALALPPAPPPAYQPPMPHPRNRKRLNMSLWNYLAHAAAKLAGLLALVAVLRLLAVYVGNKVWTGRGGLQLNLLQASACTPLAIWMFTVSGVIG